jgi:multicomponent Na+:H+ antiporter subunit F
MIGLVAIAGVSIALIMTLLRLFSGPSLYDRAMAATLVLIELALIVAGAAVFVGEAAIVDVAVALVFVAIVVAVAVLKFFRARTFQPALVRAGEDS